MSRWLGLVLRLVLVAGCLVYLLWDMDSVALLEAVKTMSWPALALAGGLLVLDYVGMGLRLRFVARGQVSFATAFNADVVGLGVNNILPAKAGEFAKALFLRSQGQTRGFGQVMGFVFWERFADLNALVLLALVAASMSGASLVAWPLAVATAGLWGGLIVLQVAPGIVEKLLGLVPFDSLKNFVRDLAEQLRVYLELGYLVRLALLSSLVWGLYFLQHYVLLKYAAGLDLGSVQVLVVFVMAAGGMALPSTPGALGVYEAFMVAALALFGVPKEQALAVGLVYHMMLYVPSTVYALVVLARKGVSLRQLSNREETQPQG